MHKNILFSLYYFIRKTCHCTLQSPHAPHLMQQRIGHKQKKYVIICYTDKTAFYSIPKYGTARVYSQLLGVNTI